MTRRSDVGFEFGYRDPPAPQGCDVEQLESRNSVALIEFALQYLLDHDEIVLDADFILHAHRLAVRDIHVEAGQFRTRFRMAGALVGAKAEDIPRLVDELCDHANQQTDAFYAAAFTLWRLNWFHPFSDGNGRVSRFLACLYVSHSHAAQSGTFAYGEVFMVLRSRFRDEYFAALEAADQLWAKSDQGYQDPNVVFKMEMLLRDIHTEVTCGPSSPSGK